LSKGQDWISEHWEEVPIVALAAACFAAAEAIGGSGFIACFVGGLLLSGLHPVHNEELLSGAVATGEALALPTWIAFGVGTLAPIIARLSWQGLTYAGLSLTVIRAADDPAQLLCSRSGRTPAPRPSGHPTPPRQQRLSL
jgi:sodium/hydrogen antiporter